MDWVAAVAGAVAGAVSGFLGAWIAPWAHQRAEAERLRVEARREIIAMGRALAFEHLGERPWYARQDRRFLEIRRHLSTEVQELYEWPEDEPHKVEPDSYQYHRQNDQKYLLEDLDRLEREWKLV